MSQLQLAIQPTVRDCAYFAGLVDGEGCIAIYRRSSGQGWQLRLQVAMSDKPVLEWVQRHFGGNLLPKTLDKTCRAPKQLWSWYVNDGTAERVLREILPYLRGKFEQAYLSLRFRAEVPPSGKRWAFDTAQLQERYVYRVKELKRREYPRTA